MNRILSTLKSSFQRNRKFAGFTVFVLILCLLNPIINSINGRFFVSDFTVFYLAAKDLLAGGKVYMISFGLDSGLYKYSPMTLLFFIPYTLFSFKIAAIIHLLILSFCYWYSFLLTRKILSKWFFPVVKKEGWLLSLAVICTLIFLVKELYLGNINILLILLCLLALNDILLGKQWTAGILIGIVLLAKPFFLILILPLVLRKKCKTIAAIAITLSAGFVIPFFILGFERALLLHMDWVKTVLLHGSDFPSMNSIDYLLHYYLFPGRPEFVQYLIIITAGMLAGYFVMINIRKEKVGNNAKGTEQRNFIIEWFLIMSIIPNVMKTDSEHFLASIPIIAFIIYYIAFSWRLWLIPLFAVMIFFYGANSQDALGKDLSYRFFSMGLIGISNLFLILMTLMLYMDFRYQENSSGSANADTSLKKPN